MQTTVSNTTDYKSPFHIIAMTKLFRVATHEDGPQTDSMVLVVLLVADHGFENGTSNPLNSSSSSPAVTAQIASNNDDSPLTAQSGDGYL